MKRIVLALVLFVSLIGASFAENFFSHRFFEFKVDVPVDVSNNMFGLTDIFQKDQDVVIDLEEIAKNVAFKGAAVKAAASPSVGFKLDIPKGLILGLSFGAEVDVGVGLSKDLFELLGTGNAGMGNNFEMKTSNTYADIFATVQLDGGWNFKTSRLEISGTAFSALAHIEANETTARVYMDDSTNTAGAEASIKGNVYTPINVNQMDDVMGLVNSMGKNIGFDVTAKYQRDIFRFLTVGAQARIPLVPSRLSTAYSVNESFNPDPFKFDTLMGGGTSADPAGSGSGSGSSLPPATEDDEGEGLEAILGKPTDISANPYCVHRPMKLGISANFHPFGTLLTTSGYLGLGFRHPFAAAINKANGGFDETQFYVD